MAKVTGSKRNVAARKAEPAEDRSAKLRIGLDAWIAIVIAILTLIVTMFQAHLTRESLAKEELTIVELSSGAPLAACVSVGTDDAGEPTIHNTDSLIHAVVTNTGRLPITLLGIVPLEDSSEVGDFVWIRLGDEEAVAHRGAVQIDPGDAIVVGARLLGESFEVPYYAVQSDGRLVQFKAASLPAGVGEIEEAWDSLPDLCEDK